MKLSTVLGTQLPCNIVSHIEIADSGVIWVSILAVVLLFIAIVAVSRYFLLRCRIKELLQKKDDLNLNKTIQPNLVFAWEYDVAKKEYTSLPGESLGLNKMQESYQSIHPLDKIVYDDFIKRLQEPNGKDTDSTIVHSLKSDGSITYYEITVSAIRSSTGEALRLLGVGRDISNSILNRQKGGLISKDLYAVFNLVPCALEYYDENGILTEVNNKGIELFGVLNKAALLNKKVSFKDNPLFADHINEIIESKEDITFYYEFNSEQRECQKFYDSTKRGKMILEIKFSNVNNSGSNSGFVAIISDVTESMSINQRYLQLYKENELMLQSLPVGVEIYDSNGDLVYNNEMDNEIYDIIETDADYKHSRNLFISPIVADVVKEKFQKGEEAEFEYEYNPCKTLSGAVRLVKYIKGRSRILYDAAGRVDKCIIILTDITDLRSKTRQLEDVNIKTKVALRTGQLVQWEYNCATQKFYSINEGDIRILTHDGYLGMTHPEDRPKVVEFLSLMDQGEDCEFEINVRLQSSEKGEVRYASINSVPFEWDRQGRVIRYVGFRKDTTPLFKLNEELQLLNKQKQLIIDNINSGLVYLDSNYVVQWENISIIFGEGASNYYQVGSYCYRNFGYDSPCPNCPMARALKSREIEIQQFQTSPDLIIEVLANPIIIEKDKIEGVVLRIDNVTERQRVYDELEQAKDKAEQSDKLKSAFLANMSHEIRTPLNAIVGFSDLIISAESTAEKEEYQNIIKFNSELLLRLIGDILDLSKIESGMIELKLEKIEFSSYFNQLAITLRHKLENPDVEFRCINPYTACYITLDRNRTSQILTNFVTNAIKFTQRGSIEMGYGLQKGGLYIYVKDTGIGIPQNEVNHIFHRFYKVNEFDQGFGLGMAICKAIVERKRGKIGVSSVEGKGSTFWAWIPVTAEVEL